MMDYFNADANGTTFDLPTTMKTFAWTYNILFIGIPWAGFSFLCWAYNIGFNAYMNYWWAGGNAYLVWNTIYITI